MGSLTWAIVLVALGLATIVIELFVPSAGLLGVASAILLLSGIVSAFLHSMEAGAATLILLVLLLPVLFVALVKVWPSTPIGRRILLGRMREEEVVLRGEHYDGLKDLIGETGTAKTKMLPSGIVAIQGKTYDAVSDGFAIEPGQSIRVTAVRTNRLFVQPYDPADDQPTKFEGNDLLGKSLEELGIDPLDSNRS
jgi:membrane-bound ClpP family serine protease